MPLNDPLEEPIRSSYAMIEPCVTRDGSVSREPMHPSVQGNRRQSLAEAIVAPGARPCCIGIGIGRLERVMGIEPTSRAWEAFVLPLNYTRLRRGFYCGLGPPGSPPDAADALPARRR